MTSPIPRSLAIAGTCLLAISGALFWTGTAAAQEVEIEDGGVSLAGGPLSLNLSVVDTDETPVEIEIFLDGRSISRQSLAPGKHALKLDAGALPTGRHLIEVGATDSGGVTTTASVKIAVTQIAPPRVEIDIKPGSDPNSINLRSKGVIPVAILTTEDFDATTVDPLSVEFGQLRGERLAAPAP